VRVEKEEAFMATQRPTVKLDADTIRALDTLSLMIGPGRKKSRHRTILFAVELSGLVVMWDRARRAGEITQGLEPFLRLAAAALHYEFGPR
jgi:hypothetical protein